MLSPKAVEDERDGNDSDTSVDSGSTSGPNFNYILSMPLWCLTKEKVDELLKQRDSKVLEPGPGKGWTQLTVKGRGVSR